MTFPDVVQYQIGYDGQTLTVRLVLRAGSSAEAPAQVRSALNRALHEAGAAPPPVTTIRFRRSTGNPGTRASTNSSSSHPAVQT
jgi:hypothetical protein